MVRKLNVAMEPTPTLLALTHLAGEARSGGWPDALGKRLRKEVERSLGRLERPLSELEACLRWLGSRGLATFSPPVGTRGRAKGREAWRSAVELQVDLPSLEVELSDDDGDPEGEGHATAFALRSVLRDAASSGLWSVRAARGPLGEALEALEDALERADGALTEKMPAVITAGRRPRREPEAPGADASPEPPRVRVAATEEATEKPGAKASGRRSAPPRETRTGRKAGGAGSAGFGGLPDDAQPEDRREVEPVGPRGLTADAEFFLEQGGIDAWPCDVAALERARKRAIARLHPDRAGEASTGAFHRAIKGHAEALGKLEAARALAARLKDQAAAQPQQPSPPPPTAKPAQAPATPSSVCEWPPRASAPARSTPPPSSSSGAPTAPPARHGGSERGQGPVFSDDAEFFVREARISWPCDRATLQTAWRLMAARYRKSPRESPEPLARANRGYTDLLQMVARRRSA